MDSFYDYASCFAFIAPALAVPFMNDGQLKKFSVVCLYGIVVFQFGQMMSLEEINENLESSIGNQFKIDKLHTENTAMLAGLVNAYLEDESDSEDEENYKDK